MASPLLALVALFCLLGSAISSPAGALLWSQTENPALSSLPSLASLSTLADYSALIVFSSANPSHHTASEALFSQISAAAASRFLSSEESVQSTVSSLLAKIPNVVTVSISTQEELEAVVLPQAGSFLLVQVSLPSDVAAADQLTEEVTAKVAKFGKALSIYAAAPNAALVTKFSGRTLNRAARAVTAENDGDLFEVYTFFSSGVWMGIFATVLMLFILIPSLMCLSDLQTPSQFEKSPTGSSS